MGPKTRIAVGLTTAIVLLASVRHDETAAQAPPSAGGQPAPVAQPSGILPVVVDIPGSVTSPEDARPFFDDFSWRSLIALSWPADPARRGAPKSPRDPGVFLKAGSSYPAVWGSYREAYELFRFDGSRPLPFGAKEQSLPFCAGVPAGTKVLLMGTKSGTLLQATSQSFSYPLVDQNLNYVYYEIRFNRDQYDFVRGGDKIPASWLYIASTLAAAESKAPISMPISAPQPYQQGAVMLKAAWKQLAAPDPRYYTVPAVIYDPSAKIPCAKTLVGLIGFHIAHKVKDFPQWIWSSFEHVDNVPNDDGSKPPGPMTLNNGEPKPETVGGWANRPDSQQARAEGSARCRAGHAAEPDSNHARRALDRRHQRRLPQGADRHRVGELPACHHAMADRRDAIPAEGPRRRLSPGLRQPVPGRQRGQYRDGDLLPVAGGCGGRRRQQLHALSLQCGRRRL